MADQKYTFVSWQEASQLGLTHYVGRPCRYGHKGVRYTKNYKCVECLRLSLNGRHPLYETWRSMKKRCYNLKNIGYPKYGGHGIKVCDRWLNSFLNFVVDIGPPPDDRLKYWTVHRINSDGDYEPANVCWATKKRQTRDRSVTKLTIEKVRLIRLLWAQGQVKTLAKEFGVSEGHIREIVRNRRWKEDEP